MKKKLISGLALMLATALLAGCSGGSSSSVDVSGTGNESKGETSKSGKPEEINVMIWDRGTAAPGTTQENNSLTKYIQEEVLEECNVKVNFIPVPRSGSDDKVNVMMAGGNAPDVVLTYSRTMFGDYADKGGLTDLSPYIEEFGPRLKEELVETLEVGVLDGVQYAIPARRNVQKVKHLGYIRKDWVDALGMEIPTTKQELIEILYAFKEQDPGNVGKQLVPWAMGGNQDTEKYYLNFVGSYARTDVEKDKYVYSDKMKALQPGAEEGFKVLNQLYNEEIISKDFAVDTNDDKYKQDIINGNVGFFVEDNFRAIDQDWLEGLQENVPTAEFVPINAFENPDGEYVNPADPVYGLYMMVPKTSEKKAGAVVKYLDWLSDTENAMNVYFTPEHTLNEDGIPNQITDDELEAKGYPKNGYDFCIITQFWNYHGDKESVVAEWVAQYPTFSEDYFETVYNACKTGIYNEPVIQEVLPLDTKYSTSLAKSIIEFAYKVISTSTTGFDKVYQAEYTKLLQSGLEEVLNERGQYYDEKVAK